jgi:hypothetical protein
VCNLNCSKEVNLPVASLGPAPHQPVTSKGNCHLGPWGRGNTFKKAEKNLFYRFCIWIIWLTTFSLYQEPNLYTFVEKIYKKTIWGVGRGLKGRGDGGDLTNVQYKPNQNCHYEYPHHEYILIKNYN